MKTAKFFELAKLHGLESCEVVISKDTSIDMNVYQAEVENYSMLIPV